MPFHPRHRRFLTAGSAATLLGAVAGCNLIGAVAYKVSQDVEIPAKYVLDKDASVIVLVENYRTPDLAANDAELLARTLHAKLEEKKAAKLIKSEKIFDLRNSRPKDFPTMSVPAIAKAVGADQVIYVDLQSGGIGSLTGTSMFQGKALAAVKVIDAKTGVTLYPPDSVDGVTVAYETSLNKGNDEGTYASVRSDLYNGLAQRIGRQFYPWKQEEDEEN